MHDIRGCGRTSIGDIDVRPKRLERTSEGRATTVERAADSRGTLVSRESAAQLTPAATPTEL